MCEKRYEVGAVIALVLVGAFCLVCGSSPAESYAKLSAPSQIDISPRMATAKDVPDRRLGVPPARLRPNDLKSSLRQSEGACISVCL